MNNTQRSIAILIDPDKTNTLEKLTPLMEKINLVKPSLIFIGGSTVSITDLEFCVSYVKANSIIPVIIFPGSNLQISDKADAILFLSLISGRNPDFLIGHQVAAAPHIKKMNITTIPTGYILIDGGKTSAVSYVSQTTPIPQDQISIAINTAIAGEMLGFKTLFLDAGSGANTPVSPEIINAVKMNTSLPLIIGGGIKSIAQIELAFDAGANVIVIGNKIEEDIDFLLDLKAVQKSNTITPTTL